MAGVAFAVEGDGVGFATESYAASALYTTLASLSGALWRIRWVRHKHNQSVANTRPTSCAKHNSLGSDSRGKTVGKARTLLLDPSMIACTASARLVQHLDGLC